MMSRSRSSCLVVGEGILEQVAEGADLPFEPTTGSSMLCVRASARTQVRSRAAACGVTSLPARDAKEPT